MGFVPKRASNAGDATGVGDADAGDGGAEEALKEDFSANRKMVTVAQAATRTLLRMPMRRILITF
jgi:hypothetical protein